MTRIDVTNNILLSVFLPHVSFRGKTQIALNEKQYPTQDQLMDVLWNTFDQGHEHACKQFELPQLPPDINKEILSYLYQTRVSSQYAKQFWASIYLDQLVALRQQFESKAMLFESLYGSDEYFHYGFRYYEIRLYRIEEKIKLYKSYQSEIAVKPIPRLHCHHPDLPSCREWMALAEQGEVEAQ